MNFAWRLIFKINFIRSAAGPDSSGAMSSNKRLQQTQAQVDEVSYISVCTGAADITCALVHSYGTITGEQLCLAHFKSDQRGFLTVQYYQARNWQINLLFQTKGQIWDKCPALFFFGDYCTLFLAPGPLSRSAGFFCLIHNPVTNLSMLVVKNCLLIV